MVTLRVFDTARLRPDIYIQQQMIYEYFILKLSTVLIWHGEKVVNVCVYITILHVFFWHAGYIEELISAGGINK